MDLTFFVVSDFLLLDFSSRLLGYCLSLDPLCHTGLVSVATMLWAINLSIFKCFLKIDSESFTVDLLILIYSRETHQSSSFTIYFIVLSENVLLTDSLICSKLITQFQNILRIFFRSSYILIVRLALKINPKYKKNSLFRIRAQSVL